MKPWERFVWPALTVAVIVSLWHIAVAESGTRVFPAPAQVAHGFEELIGKGLLWNYIKDSLLRVTSGYLLAVCCGLPLGTILGWQPAAAAVVNPVIQILRPISPLAWIPLAVAWFGISDLASVFLIFLGAFFVVVISTMNAVRSVPAVFLQAGRNFGLSPLGLLARVITPAALPQTLIGLRLGLGIAWLVVVAAEMIAVDSGLGYLILDSRNAGKRYELVLAGILLIGLIGLCLDAGIRRLEKLKFVSWGFRYE